MILCIHCDADDFSDSQTFNTKIGPAFEGILPLNENEYCKNLVAIVPVVMTESWMLADTNLLKSEIGANQSDADLGFNLPPERIRDPKLILETAIRTVRHSLPKRRRRDITLSELYLPLGQKMDLKHLEKVSSYRKFIAAVKESLKKIGYLRA